MLYYCPGEVCTESVSRDMETKQRPCLRIRLNRRRPWSSLPWWWCLVWKRLHRLIATVLAIPHVWLSSWPEPQHGLGEGAVDLLHNHTATFAGASELELPQCYGKRPNNDAGLQKTGPPNAACEFEQVTVPRQPCSQPTLSTNSRPLWQTCPTQENSPSFPGVDRAATDGI